MAGSEQRFETEDMTFVTVLLINGITHSKMLKQGRGCRWVYLGSEVVVGKIMEHLDEYNDNAAYVDPREFTIKMGTVRREMYQFLDYAPPRVNA